MEHLNKPYILAQTMTVEDVVQDLISRVIGQDGKKKKGKYYDIYKTRKEKYIGKKGGDMSVMKIKAIACSDSNSFEEQVNEFLEEKEEMILHEKTIFAITTNTFRGNVYTMYSVIFFGEL